MMWQIFAWSRLADAAAGGLIVLAVGSLAARLCRQPVRRARLVVLTLIGAVAVPGLGALPIAPRWSAGLLPAPAPPPHHARPDDGASRGAGSRLGVAETAQTRKMLEPGEWVGEAPARRPAPFCPRPIGNAEALLLEWVDSAPCANRCFSVLFRRGGGGGGLVVRRAARALAGHAGGTSRPGRCSRRVPWPRRIPG